jgi:hypothetical protein
VTDHQTSFFPEGRDRGVTVAVEGFFAFVWFGWGQAAPSTVTGAGAGLCLLAFGLVTLLKGRPLYGDPSDGLRLPRSQPEGKA